ncbi:MAG TPA: Maf family nucleotide pyrophosphatase [Hyphomicrobiaceae bacterium]|nr:Maf family nucleotide pyrophosphatase [Hyphomicrobiaceae bacterium]
MIEAAPRKLVLASASPFRRKMLEAAGIAFCVAPAQVDEADVKRHLAGRVDPAGMSEALAALKAEAVSREHPASLVIGSDQVVALGEEIFDKPVDLAAARAQLQRLRGQTHQLVTAVALAMDGRVVWRTVDKASLTMRPFSDPFLEGYLAECGSRLCQIAGAYEIEGRGIQLFDRVEGDHFTIVGLPLLPLLAELRARGVVAG